ncbi:hypothetical protein QUB80_23925 [Chlorogloeopsis sp. ULAP01]|uniref:hypothetical protein n=1 Tax=Chlorogloeopsis sp. ULAP01 TaxID=3056483 RepID=UPI0025AABB92|nr:hypothetical protein [Chlorogloeopsis sp. ULAP01]MDM9383738.1 hypothetical protein [Chlorogloeopsis sp. ULAP01]
MTNSLRCSLFSVPCHNTKRSLLLHLSDRFLAQILKLWIWDEIPNPSVIYRFTVACSRAAAA